MNAPQMLDTDRNGECSDCPALIRERDEAQEWADELASLIAQITGADIGEHSNLNNPWEQAAIAAEAFIDRNAEPTEAQQGLIPIPKGYAEQ